MVKMNATRLFVLLCALSWAGSVTADVFDVEEVLAGPAGLPSVVNMGPVQDGRYGQGRRLTGLTTTLTGYEGPNGNYNIVVVSAISTILGTPNLAPTVDALKTTVNRAAADTNASPLLPDIWISGSVSSFGPNIPLSCSPTIPSNFALLFYTITVNLFDDRVSAFLADLSAAVEGGEFTADAQAAGIAVAPVPVLLPGALSEVSVSGASDSPAIDWQCFTLVRVPEVTQVPEPTKTPRPDRPTPTPTLRRRLLQAEELITESEESKP